MTLSWYQRAKINTGESTLRNFFRNFLKIRQLLTSIGPSSSSLHFNYILSCCNHLIKADFKIGEFCSVISAPVLSAYTSDPICGFKKMFYLKEKKYAHMKD